MNLTIMGHKNCYAVIVTTTPTPINTNGKRIGLVIRNNETENVVYLGSDNGVTAENGFPLSPFDLICDPSCYSNVCGKVDNWYGVTKSGTVDLRVIEYLRQI